MNQIFYVEELVKQIALNADDGPQGSASLLAFACCCKTVEGPVMDVLWQRQKYLHIILRTLPEDCWTTLNNVYHITRTPATNEWDRFRKYTARVVELFVGKVYILLVGGAHRGEVSSETISFLGMQSTLDPLWPRLASLTLADGLGWDALTPTLTFLSPKITTLTLVLPRDNSILLQPTLSIASDRCRLLQELVLDLVTDDPHSGHWVGGLISACRDTLRALQIKSHFKAEYLPVMANLTRLRNLKLERVHFPLDLPLDAFPALEEITFTRSHGQRLPHFFERLYTTDLKVVKINCTDTIASKELIAALSRSSATLRALEISSVADLHLPSVVVPCLFTNLKNVRLRCSCSWAATGSCAFRHTDQVIAELGAAAPNITHLSLGSTGCPNAPRNTFLSLVSLSKTCKALEILTIKVDFQTMVPPSLYESEDVEADAFPDGSQDSACKLRRLFVGLSTLPNHPESGWIVAIGLGKIFPLLSEVVGNGPGGTKWGQVSRNIRTLRQIHRAVQ